MFCGVAALSIEIENFIFLHFFFAKKWQQKNRVKTVSFARVFPAHGFGSPQTYKIKNTGVDGPCP